MTRPRKRLRKERRAAGEDMNTPEVLARVSPRSASKYIPRVEDAKHEKSRRAA